MEDPTAAGQGWAPRATLIRLGLVALFFVLIAVVASFTRPTTTTDAFDQPVQHYGLLSLLPAGVAIAMAFATRQVLLALFLGIASGGVVYAFGSGIPVWQIQLFPWARANLVETFFLQQIGTRTFAIILFVYLWCLGGLIGLWGRTGGAMHFAERVGEKLVRGPRSAKVFTWLIGLVFHQGGTISTLLAGTTSRPLLDTNRVAKEESAYIVNSTASPVAVLLPFNAWPVFVGGLVAGTVPLFTRSDGTADVGAAIAFFFRSMPFYFYAMLSVLFTLLLALGVLPAVFAMRRARRRVQETGELVRPGSEPLQAEELTELRRHPGYPTGLSDFLLPLGFLVAIAVAPFLMRRALGDRSAAPYIVEAFFLALLVGILVALVKGMPIKVALGGVVDGAKGVTMAAIILALAFTLKGVGDGLGTGYFMADLLGGVLAPSLVPLLLMLTAMAIAFSTGTSFGTFTVVFPVAMPLAWAVLPDNELFLAMSFGAVVSGAVFGDQASPISDTAILSSVATGCDLMDHVGSQLPYALLAAAGAGLLYVLLGVALF